MTPLLQSNPGNLSTTTSPPAWKFKYFPKIEFRTLKVKGMKIEDLKISFDVYTGYHLHRCVNDSELDFLNLIYKTREEK